MIVCYYYYLLLLLLSLQLLIHIAIITIICFTFYACVWYQASGEIIEGELKGRGCCCLLSDLSFSECDTVIAHTYWPNPLGEQTCAIWLWYWKVYSWSGQLEETVD